MLKQTRAGVAQLAELMERHRVEIHALADNDRKTALLDRHWHGVLMVTRELDMTRVSEAGRFVGN